jgi:hypothetical protein
VSECATCRYAIKRTDRHTAPSTFFECRRFPPVPPADRSFDNFDVPFAAWPLVSADDWCGEWEQELPAPAQLSARERPPT